MPGPYYNNWTGPAGQHPSNEATREEIEAIQTAEDAVRLFPDHHLAEQITVLRSPRETTPPEIITDPVEIGRMHVQHLKAMNPYTCEFWWRTWMLKERALKKRTTSRAGQHMKPSA